MVTFRLRQYVGGSPVRSPSRGNDSYVLEDDRAGAQHSTKVRPRASARPPSTAPLPVARGAMGMRSTMATAVRHAATRTLLILTPPPSTGTAGAAMAAGGPR
jgi:hypothetical protein